MKWAKFIMSDALRKGRVELSGEYGTLTFVRRLPHPAQLVWRAITDSSELSKWHMEASLDGRVGGIVEFSSGLLRVTGRILVWEPRASSRTNGGSSGRAPPSQNTVWCVGN
jgi:hypothetical protein